MKTHDCHVLLQRVLHVILRGLGRPDLYRAVAELGQFFKQLCSRNIMIDALERLRDKITTILCDLEKIYPPAFFDVMVHLAIHLPDEALLRGPVQYGWMYPIERRLGTEGLISLAKRWVKTIPGSMFSIVLFELQGRVDKTTNIKKWTKWFGMC